MESELNVEKLLENQMELLEQLQLETIVLKSRKNLKDVIAWIRDSVVDISNGIITLKKHLDQMKEKNSSLQEMLSLFHNLNEKILHMNNNISEEMITLYRNDNKKESMESVCISSSPTPKTENNKEEESIDIKDTININTQEASCIKDCKKALFNEPEYPQISMLKKTEFDIIPKYMIGRQSLQMINGLINSINQVLKAKYSLLFAGKAIARKKGELDLYLHYKKQDIVCEKSECKYFFTAEDYERYVKVKLDRLALKTMMGLRHCKRIREYRLQKELYYIILN